MDRLSGPPPLIWVTRSLPAAEETAALVEAEGFGALIDPVLETRDVGAQSIDLEGFGALAFTSANAVAAFVRRQAKRTLPAYAVGPATARAVREAGFADVREAAGDVAALARFIADDPRRAAPILHPRAAAPAGDLVGDLRRRGVAAAGVAVYETRERRPTAAIAAGPKALAAILLHSPRAARAVAGLLAASPARPRILCLSPAIAEAFAAALPPPAQDFAVSAAQRPTDDALLDLLRRSARQP